MSKNIEWTDPKHPLRMTLHNLTTRRTDLLVSSFNGLFARIRIQTYSKNEAILYTIRDFMFVGIKLFKINKSFDSMSRIEK